MPNRLLFILALALPLALSLTACTTTQSISRDNAASLREQTLALALHPAGEFQVMTSGNMLWGGLGAIGAGILTSNALSHGARVAQEHALQDPAPALATRLVQPLQRQWGMRLVNPPLNSTDDDPAALAASAKARARYLLSVQTQGWGMHYLSATRYMAQYNARARLIDTQTAQVIAQADCHRMPPSDVDDRFPTYDQMLANGASVLKQHMRQAVDECLNTLHKRLLPG